MRWQSNKQRLTTFNINSGDVKFYPSALEDSTKEEEELFFIQFSFQA